MTRDEFLSSMDRLVELPPGTLRGPEKLDELEQWDSVALMEFIALANSYNGANLSPKDIARCQTVADLLALAQVQA